MAGFVGFMAAANYETVGAPMAKTMYAPIASGLSAPEVWDAIPFLAKLQIIGAIGCLEHISEDKNLCALPPPPSNTHTIDNALLQSIVRSADAVLFCASLSFWRFFSTASRRTA